jgi:hypothetical protein
MSLFKEAESIGFSQLPDQIQLEDGYSSGSRNFAPNTAASAAEVVKAYEEGVHALNGQSVLDCIKFYMNAIDTCGDNAEVFGTALHGLQDSIFHAQYSGNDFDELLLSKTYMAPIGHGWEGSEPDYMTKFKLDTATLLLTKAYGDVTGMDQDEFDAARTAAVTKVDNLYQRASVDANGNELSGKALDDSIRSTYHIEYNRFDPGAVNIPDPIFGRDGSGAGNVFTNQVTFASDVDNVAEFLKGTPLQDEDPEQFLARGLNAAKFITNAYNQEFNAGLPEVTDTNYGQDAGGSYAEFLNVNGKT